MTSTTGRGFAVEFKAPGGRSTGTQWTMSPSGLGKEISFARALSSLYAKIVAVLYLKCFFAGFHLTSQQSTEPTSMTQLAGPLFRLLDPNARKRCEGWFLVLGIAEIVIGLIALGASAVMTLVSAVLFGWLLLVGGILSAGHAFWRKQRRGMVLELGTGIVYAIAGVMIVANPGEAAISLTLLIAMFLWTSGLLRIAVALIGGLPHWGWVLLNGVMTAGLGVLIWREWPLSGLWVIGLFIGIDMVVYGWSLVMRSLMAKSLPQPAGMSAP